MLTMISIYLKLKGFNPTKLYAEPVCFRLESRRCWSLNTYLLEKRGIFGPRVRLTMYLFTSCFHIETEYHVLAFCIIGQ